MPSWHARLSVAFLPELDITLVISANGIEFHLAEKSSAKLIADEVSQYQCQEASFHRSILTDVTKLK